MEKRTRQKTVCVDYDYFVADDGREFKTEEECLNYEEECDTADANEEKLYSLPSEENILPFQTGWFEEISWIYIATEEELELLRTVQKQSYARHQQKDSGDFPEWNGAPRWVLILRDVPDDPIAYYSDEDLLYNAYLDWIERLYWACDGRNKNKLLRVADEIRKIVGE